MTLSSRTHHPVAFLSIGEKGEIKDMIRTRRWRNTLTSTKEQKKTVLSHLQNINTKKFTIKSWEKKIDEKTFRIFWQKKICFSLLPVLPLLPLPVFPPSLPLYLHMSHISNPGQYEGCLPPPSSLKFDVVFPIARNVPFLKEPFFLFFLYFKKY